MALALHIIMMDCLFRSGKTRKDSANPPVHLKQLLLVMMNLNPLRVFFWGTV